MWTGVLDGQMALVWNELEAEQEVALVRNFVVENSHSKTGWMRREEQKNVSVFSSTVNWRSFRNENPIHLSVTYSYHTTHKMPPSTSHMSIAVAYLAFTVFSSPLFYMICLLDSWYSPFLKRCQKIILCFWLSLWMCLSLHKSLKCLRPLTRTCLSLSSHVQETGQESCIILTDQDASGPEFVRWSYRWSGVLTQVVTTLWGFFQDVCALSPTLL